VWKRTKGYSQETASNIDDVWRSDWSLGRQLKGRAMRKRWEQEDFDHEHYLRQEVTFGNIPNPFFEIEEDCNED